MLSYLEELKFLEKSEESLTGRLMKACEALVANPFPKGVKRVEDQSFEGEKVFRIRVGDYRVLYVVSYEKKRVMIVNIDKRARVY